MAQGKLDRELAALFKEYDTLRAEVLARVRARFELLGVLVAGTTIVLSTRSFWLLVPFCFGIGGLWLYLGTAITRCAQRIVELEARINLVVRSDRELPATDPLPMQWETRQSGSWFNNLLHR